MPGKNIRPLLGKPLIAYSLELARAFTDDSNICISTDDDAIISCVEQYGYRVPFRRPAELASDTAGSYEVMLHALQHYEREGRFYERMVLLQPTSPFRLRSQLEEALALYSPGLDMVVSVKRSEDNPYYNLFEESGQGFLVKSKPGDFQRRQDCPPVYAYNGSIYIVNINSLKRQPLHQFTKVVKYEMPAEFSIDIDNRFDWLMAEAIGKELFSKI